MLLQLSEPTVGALSDAILTGVSDPGGIDSDSAMRVKENNFNFGAVLPTYLEDEQTTVSEVEVIPSFPDSSVLSVDREESLITRNQPLGFMVYGVESIHRDEDADDNIPERNTAISLEGNSDPQELLGNGIIGRNDNFSEMSDDEPLLGLRC